MKLLARTAAMTAIVAFSATPALAQGPPQERPTPGNNPGTAFQPENPGTAFQQENPGTAYQQEHPGTAYQQEHQPEGTPNQSSNPGTQSQEQGRPSATPTAEDNPGTARKLAAPGRYCKDASKKRVDGQKGTAFSACVKAQARLRSGKVDSPREACKGASKKHVKGQKGTAFSTCVKAAAKLLKDQKAAEEQDAEQEQEQG